MCKFHTFFSWDFALVLQVTLVSYKHYLQFVVRVFLDIFKPLCNSIKSIPSRNIINQTTANCTSIIWSCDWLKSFLARCVPHLQFTIDSFIDLYDSACELNSNCHIVTRCKLALTKTHQDTRFAHSRIAHYDEFECVSVLICLHFILIKLI